MRRFLGLGAALTLAASGLIVSSGPASAEVPVIPCDSPVNTPPVAVPDPDGSGPAPGLPVLSEGNTCAELVRTLVFVGVAEIDNGVNFNGVGGVSPGDFTNAPTGYFPGEGGTYTYGGDCVMVNWENPVLSSVPADDPIIGDCEFGTVDGFYTAPTTADPIFNPVMGGIADGVGNGSPEAEEALTWAPITEASCLSSSGTGKASFTSRSPGLNQTEVWTSDYDWNNSLRNLRGTITDGSRPFNFDAKIEAHANPQASDGPLDQTDAGCLQRPLNDLTSQASNPRTGLNSILITGTATWRLDGAPELFSE